MKTLIIYNSQTGFTAKYAQWMAEMICGSYDISDRKYAQPVIDWIHADS